MRSMTCFCIECISITSSAIQLHWLFDHVHTFIIVCRANMLALTIAILCRACARIYVHTR